MFVAVERTPVEWFVDQFRLVGVGGLQANVEAARSWL